MIIGENFGDLRLALWVATIVTALPLTIHVILFKRDEKSAMAWIGFLWLVPILGAFFYFMLGVNRVHRSIRLRNRPSHQPVARPSITAVNFAEVHGVPNQHLAALSSAIDCLTENRLLAGNSVTPLRNGEAAYAKMLDAIRGAKKSVALSTYIFKHDHVGEKFVAALSDAQDRGVAVRVLVDGIGKRHSSPSVEKILRKKKIPIASFLPVRFPGKLRHWNLRSHRKILVVDGEHGFAGGMNIEGDHDLSSNPKRPTADFHFALRGPIVGQLLLAFQEDWAFVTNEKLDGGIWEFQPGAEGPSFARGIPSGPDENFEQIRWALLAALNCAERSVHIVTPYFTPDPLIRASLRLCAMRGVRVHVFTPDQNHAPVVRWASNALFWQILEPGCRVWLTPPPFEHTKLVIVDEIWTLFGSSNWDSRSMRLNFEFDVECYDAELSAELLKYMDDLRARSKELSLEEIDKRSVAMRLRDGTARLFLPYL